MGWLSAVFAGVYLLLGLPAGRWIDSHFGRSLAFGVICNAVGALLRCGTRAAQLVGQLVLALGQPFVVNAISALAIRYFPGPERPTVIAAGRPIKSY